MSPGPTAAVLVVGNEILTGKIQEANVIELAKLLRSLGITLERIVVIPDDIDTIAKEITALAATHTYVFTSGGVGPTHDDVTMAGIAQAFGRKLVTDAQIEKLIRDYHGADVTAEHLLLARVPEGTKPLSTATMPWPVAVLENIWILPGVPEAFRMKLDIIHSHLQGARPYVSRAAYSQLEEADLKRYLDTIVSRHPRVEIGSYPKWNDPSYQTKVTFDGQDENEVQEALKEFMTLLPEGEPKWTE